MGLGAWDILAWRKRLDIEQSRTIGAGRERSWTDSRPEILSVDLFRRMLSLERKRVERSRKLFLLMLIDGRKLLQIDERRQMLEKTASALSSTARETDLCGWYAEDSVVGVIYTEVHGTDRSSIRDVMHAKVVTALRSVLGPGQLSLMEIAFHFFPEDWDQRDPTVRANQALYPDLLQGKDSRRFSHFVKRAMDILGSIAALVLLSPLFVVIWLAIRLTSNGPAVFRQQRVGQYGVPFTFFKFRSMKCASDPSVHREYVERFISGDVGSDDGSDDQNGVYKIREDSRVTRLGRFLRRSSLDELPQFVNVLRGEMSLVGPRPPIPYELGSYRTWHRRRVLEAKPGLTGLWQVTGRSTIRFDDMVRLDLRYARNWSLWLDIKILLRTPWALVAGAY